MVSQKKFGMIAIILFIYLLYGLYTRQIIHNSEESQQQIISTLQKIFIKYPRLLSYTFYQARPKIYIYPLSS